MKNLKLNTIKHKNISDNAKKKQVFSSRRNTLHLNNIKASNMSNSSDNSTQEAKLLEKQGLRQSQVNRQGTL